MRPTAPATTSTSAGPLRSSWTLWALLAFHVIWIVVIWMLPMFTPRAGEHVSATAILLTIALTLSSPAAAIAYAFAGGAGSSNGIPWYGRVPIALVTVVVAWVASAWIGM